MSTLVAREGVLPEVERAGFRLDRLPELLVITGQVLLALLVIRAFRLESRTFYDVALVVTLGFLPHALLPVRWRLPAFTLLSGGALALAVGLGNALWIVAIGAALVGVCHLPVRGSVRVALLVAAGGALAFARTGRVAVPWTTAVWAVLGSMFMFRLALYLHAVRNDPVKPTPMQAAAYFLMLPNPVFPLFPVVDFSTFTRTHYAEGTSARTTYQTGVAWVARGLVHLLLYRVVYQHLPADPLQLPTLSMLLWYVLGTFLLYLRVSGQFHLIVGVLHLYGFALPETHKLFFLSSSFTDFWRRINIYWKDFMMKLVYYPSFFRLRRFGSTFALVASTAAVFVVTWLLHGYQWFWLLGSWPISIPDMAFWGILGVLVIVTSLREAKRGRDRGLGAKTWSPRLAGRVLATFTALCVLWSLWSAESVVEWLWMWRAAARVDVAGVVLLAVLLAGGLAIAGRNWSAPKLAVAGQRALWQRPDVRTAATLLVLLAFSRPELVDRLGPATPLVASMRETTLNAIDAAVERRGYYERLDRGPRLGAQGWENRSQRPADWKGPEFIGLARRTHDFKRLELVPSAQLTFLRAPLTTNAWGMRDAPRTLEKPAGTRRLAMFGPSFVMGSGVPDTATFTRVLERRLNAGPAAGDAARGRYEVLNFAVSGHSLLQELMTFEERGLRFSPDVALFTTYSSMRDQTADHVTESLKLGYRIPYPGLDSVLARWHASPRVPYPELTGILRIAADDIHTWALRRIAADCRARGIVPMLVVLNVVGARADLDTHTMREATDAGFVVLNLDDVYGPAEGQAALQLAAWDNHPNAAGHALIAARLLDELRRHPETLSPRAPSAAALSLSAGPTP